ncbi:hypothetical protein Q1695_014844 [Nippostrongylus brasiliensis]|nr:hypothetical protein Q1695_014844 [Nippostrongylus brasiliensis]
MVAITTRLPQARHVYIGDIHQLDPHVRCPRASNPARFGARGVMDLLLERGVSSAPLTTTFRSHPGLVALPNELFYSNALQSGTDVGDRQMFLRAVRCPSPTPFFFVNVAGTSVRSVNGSHSNETDRESELCRQIVMTLLVKEIAPDSIAIIVFYKEQYRLLKEFARTVEVDLHTVDSVQGREKDIVVVLSTRTSLSRRLLDDPKRLNVALSRSRHGQFV